MATNLGFKIIAVAPPDMLGKTVVNVHVGQTVPISRSMLMMSAFPYMQEHDFPMGDIEILNTYNSEDYRHLLAQTNVSGFTNAYFLRNTTRIYKTSQASTTVTNAAITYAQLNANQFKVVGVSAGNKSVIYKAKAINETSSLQSDNYSTVNGQIEINVSLSTNQKPSQIGNNVIQCIQGTFTPVPATAFLVGYVDPDGDPAKDVQITALPPAGVLLYNGAPITPAMLPLDIPIAALNANALIYFADNTTSIGSTYNSTFGVSDVGTGLFTY